MEEMCVLYQLYNMILKLLEEIGINVGLIIAGLSGGLVTANKKDNWKEQIPVITAGTLSANYISPIIIDILNITNNNAGYGIAFIVGLSGLKIAEKLESYIIWYLKNGKNSKD